MSCRSRLLAASALAFALALGPASSAGAQLLRRASDTVRSSEPSRSSSRDDDRGSRRSRERSDDSTLGRSSGAVRSGGGGRGSGGRERGRWYGPRRWNYGPSYGVYVTTPAAAYAGPSLEPEHEPELRTMVVAQVEGSYVAGDVGRATAGVRVLLPAPVELHAGYSAYFEPLPGGGLEALALGRLGAAYRMIDDDDLQLRIGGSVRHWQDALGARFGGEVALGLDMFPAEPLVLGIEGAIGIVGDAWAVEVRGTVGVMLEIVELYAGWHHLALEAINGTGGVELTGPIAGVRLWI